MLLIWFIDCCLTQSFTMYQLYREVSWFYLLLLFFLSNITYQERGVSEDINTSLGDTKGIIRSHHSKNDRQYKGQKKRTNNNLQNTPAKNYDRVARTY